jgi:hypothetical protein
MLERMGLVSKRPEDEQEDQDGSEIRITGFGDLDTDGPTPIGLDLATWGETGRTALDERLHLLEAPHAWNGEVLIIDEADAAWIARIVEQVEDERSLALDPEADQIAYDLTGWDEQNLSLLVHGLQDQAVPFGMEAEELIIHEADEQKVDDLVDTILEPDGADVALDDARAEMMGELFVIADRLVHDPLEKDARHDLTAMAAEAVASAPPYGVEKAWWKGIGEQCTGLATMFLGPTEEDTVVEAATALRDALRPNV